MFAMEAADIFSGMYVYSFVRFGVFEKGESSICSRPKSNSFPGSPPIPSFISSFAVYNKTVGKSRRQFVTCNKRWVT
jgi:hypothetical protein